MRSLVVTCFAIAALASTGMPVAAQSEGRVSLSRTDSADILRSAFRLVTQGHNTRRHVIWFWTPSSPDTNAVAISPELRALLTASGLTVSENRPVGDDTVVFRVHTWKIEPDAMFLEIRSDWTTILGAGGKRPCRTGSGNVERLRLRRVNDQWIAAREGPVIHGDNVCQPIRP